MNREKESNVMRKIKIDKVVINCCVGGQGSEAVQKAAKVLSVRRSTDNRTFPVNPSSLL